MMNVCVYSINLEYGQYRPKKQKGDSMANYTERYEETYDNQEKQQASNLINSIAVDRINREEEKEMKEEIITLEYSVDRSKSDYREWMKLIEFLLQYKIPFNTTTDTEDDDYCIEYITVDDEIYRYFRWYTYGHGIFSYREGGTVDRFIVNKEGGK